MADDKDKTEVKTSANIGSYTSPFNLLSGLKRPEIKLDIIPILDLIVIALLVSLLFTRYSIVPGVKVDLPVTPMQVQFTAGPVGVLSIQNKKMLFFDGGLYQIASIRGAFDSYLERVGPEAVLLIKADAGMDMQVFLEICHIAQEAGFVQVQLGGKSPKEVEAPLPVDI